MADRQQLLDSHGERERHVHGPESPVTALAFGPTGASLSLVGQEAILMGVSLIETTGAAVAAVDLVDGADDNAPVLLPVALAAGGSFLATFSAWGIWVQRGVRVKVNSGSVRGVAYVILAGPNAGR